MELVKIDRLGAECATAAEDRKEDQAPTQHLDGCGSRRASRIGWQRPKPWSTGAILIGWLAAVLTGMLVLIDYSNKGRHAIAAAPRWPTDAPFPHATDRSTLLMFVHPRCPCTRASLGELARVMARCQDRVQAIVLFYQPSTATRDWTQTGLWREAAAIPGVEPQVDVDGATAASFGPEDSGHVLLYDPSGRLRFSGGITAGRGHEGDNAGREAVIALLREKPPQRGSTPVFGCPIRERF